MARPKKAPRKAPGRPRPLRRGIDFGRVRIIARQLPGVQDGTSYGTVALKVGGKLLARLHQNGEALVLRASFLDRQILLQADPEVFYITDHYRDYPWILVRLAAVSEAALPDLLERAWRQVAPQRLIDRFDQPDGTPF